MVNFGTVLESYRSLPDLKVELQLRAYCLAHAIRGSMMRTSAAQIDQTTLQSVGPYLNLALRILADDRKCSDAVRTK